MTHAASPLLLPHLGVIAVRGADARQFLNGQLSQDVLHLAPDRVELAGLHNPQGRAIALMRLVPVGPADVLVVLPRPLVAEILAALRKYLLRAKATIADESARWRIEGLTAPAGGTEGRLAAAMGSALIEGDTMAWRHANDGRVMRLVAVEAPATSGPTEAMRPADDAERLLDWHRADIAAGLPQVSTETRGEFVAQMLNLDALGGISFTKGCYTGQEVIARAHYRGRVKRRLQRFRTDERVALQAGQKIELTAGGWTRSAQIVDVVDVAGGTEFLAVTAFGAPASEPTESNPAESTTRVVALPQPMSYALPD